MYAPSFNQPLRLNNWDISAVENMKNIFYGANNFDIDLLEWNLKNDELNQIYLVI